MTEDDITIPVPLASAHQDDMLRYIIQTQQKHHKELTHYMATVDESLDRLFQGITTEIQQVRDELQGRITTLEQSEDTLTEENESLKTALQSADDTLAGVQARIEGKATELEANDPAPDPEA